MPGIKFIVDSLPAIHQCYTKHVTEPEQKAFLEGKLGGSYLESEYCIIIVIDYLSFCGLTVTKKTLRTFLDSHISQLNHSITRVLSSGFVAEDEVSGKLTIVPQGIHKPK